MDDRRRYFSRYAWGVLAYNILVILWGAFVRATGSGAGCGDHWPLCNGDVIPREAATATIIEFAHRVTSGLALLSVVVLIVWAFRLYPQGHRVRKAAAFSMGLMVLEALIGAGLVLLQYVAYNVSVARGYWMAAHLFNTFLLLAALTLAAWTASGGRLPRFRRSGPLGVALGVTIASVLVLGVSGAVTALGDTLTIGGGIDPASDPIVAALVGLRIYHPLLALLVGVGVAVVAVMGRRSAHPLARVFGFGALGLYLVNLSIGLVNVWLMAPVEIQILHLLVTDLIWIGLVLFAAAALGEPERRLHSA
jgi:heme A synthase